MKRIFVAAWCYPPKISGESIVCKRTFEKSQFCYDVCSAFQKIEKNDSDKIRVYPLSGKYISWPLRVLSQFLKLDKEEHYDTMMSRVMPPNGHLAGLFIKLIKPQIKWVVYFSDPIWNSPFISFSSLFKKNMQQQPNYLLMKMFGIVAWIAVQYGDLLVFNNKRLAQYILGKQYAKMQSKVIIAPYGHDGVCTKVLCKSNHNDKVVIAHVGQIYGARTFASLIAGLELLQHTQFEKFSCIEILQVGFTCASEKNRIAKSKVAKSFVLLDEVNYENSLDYMKKSEYLLIIDPYFEEKNKNIYVPAKIFDYMSVGAETLVIADVDSATGDIAEVMGFLTACHQAEEIANMLLCCVAGIDSIHVDDKNRFHCSHGIEMLDERMRRL